MRIVRTALSLLAVLVVGACAYLVLWPVAVEPVAWQAPKDEGFAGPFVPNGALAQFTAIPLGAHEGPEAVARDAQGRVYVSTRGGVILRLTAEGADPVAWADTKGRPLGLAFDSAGTLFVADGRRGLLAVDTAGTVRLLADSADGTRIEFADDLAVAADGKVYFSDASTKFGVSSQTDEEASVLDIIEHGAHGRLLEWDPRTGTATVVRAGLQFANGVAMTPDQRAVFLCETGAYRVVRIGVVGNERGRLTPVLENLPGFPDNISLGLDGRYWVALFAPRNALLDALSARPFLRKVVARIPRMVRPRAAEYGHVFAMSAEGVVINDRQDPGGAYPKMTDVLETERYLFIGSLQGNTLARVPR
jgi:sugar lactone lactonase YvrE